MDKAYELKALGQMIADEAKKNGLEIAEEAVELLAKASYLGFQKWAKESAVLSDNKIDDVAANFYSHLDGFVLPQIEKIDLDGDGD